MRAIGERTADMKSHFAPRVALALLYSAIAFSAEPPRTSSYTVGPSVQPLVITGEGWTQQFTFINVDYYDKQRTVGTLYFYTQDGNPWKIPLQGLGTVDHVDINLASGQMLALATVTSFGTQRLGWANFALVDDTSQMGDLSCLYGISEAGKRPA